MGSDFSALDAELDTLSAGAVQPAEADALALASHYASDLAALSDIDAALSELDTSGACLAQAHTSRELHGFDAALSGERARAPESEEIVLPDPMLRERADESGELLLGPAERSGSFSLEGSGILPGGRDDTIETTDEELAEADVDLLDIRSEAAPMTGDGSLFDLKAPVNAAEQEEADAAFAALFEEATRQSSMPRAAHSIPPAPYAPDTALFDGDSVDFEESLQERDPMADTIAAEELDSAEFEIVLDADDDGPPSGPSARPSQAPEKRPSFLGRLFGRKED